MSAMAKRKKAASCSVICAGQVQTICMQHVGSVLDCLCCIAGPAPAAKKPKITISERSLSDALASAWDGSRWKGERLSQVHCTDAGPQLAAARIAAQALRCDAMNLQCATCPGSPLRITALAPVWAVAMHLWGPESCNLWSGCLWSSGVWRPAM